MSDTKKYTVKKFCDKYNSLNIAQAKGALIASIMNIHYVPYERKVTICEMIVERTYYNKIDKNGVEVKKFHVNSPANHMLYCLNLIREYTTLEINFNDMVNEFNALNGCEILDLIYEQIPERELKEFRIILDMVESDVMQNEYELHAFISNQVERFRELFGFILNPVINELQKSIENYSVDDLKKIIDFTKINKE